MRDVAITGIGVISCIGQSADEYFTRLDAGEHGVTAAPWAEPVREPSYDDPQPVPEPDPSRFNPTWQIPAPAVVIAGIACPESPAASSNSSPHSRQGGKGPNSCWLAREILNAGL